MLLIIVLLKITSLQAMQDRRTQVRWLLKPMGE